MKVSARLVPHRLTSVQAKRRLEVVTANLSGPKRRVKIFYLGLLLLMKRG